MTKPRPNEGPLARLRRSKLEQVAKLEGRTDPASVRWRDVLQIEVEAVHECERLLTEAPEDGAQGTHPKARERRQAPGMPAKMRRGAKKRAKLTGGRDG